MISFEFYPALLEVAAKFKVALPLPVEVSRETQLSPPTNSKPGASPRNSITLASFVGSGESLVFALMSNVPRTTQEIDTFYALPNFYHRSYELSLTIPALWHDYLFR
jgi:hypothetical protein